MSRAAVQNDPVPLSASWKQQHSLCFLGLEAAGRLLALQIPGLVCKSSKKEPVRSVPFLGSSPSALVHSASRVRHVRAFCFKDELPREESRVVLCWGSLCKAGGGAGSTTSFILGADAQTISGACFCLPQLHFLFSSQESSQPEKQHFSAAVGGQRGPAGLSGMAQRWGAGG